MACRSTDTRFLGGSWQPSLAASLTVELYKVAGEFVQHFKFFRISQLQKCWFSGREGKLWTTWAASVSSRAVHQGSTAFAQGYPLRKSLILNAYGRLSTTFGRPYYSR
jgi:hypothetical protein